jgi:hypothetical protein
LPQASRHSTGQVNNPIVIEKWTDLYYVFGMFNAQRKVPRRIWIQDCLNLQSRKTLGEGHLP